MFRDVNQMHGFEEVHEHNTQCESKKQLLWWARYAHEMPGLAQLGWIMR